MEDDYQIQLNFLKNVENNKEKGYIPRLKI